MTSLAAVPQPGDPHARPTNQEDTVKPFVGLPSAHESTSCAYAAHLDQPECGQPVTVHVIGRAPGWGWVALNTCDNHLGIAKAGCVEIADEHPAKGCDGEHYEPGIHP